MYSLAKLGFTQSYTCFTWRHTKAEFIECLTELTQSEVREYFWPNTPDILIEHLQTSGRVVFMIRVVINLDRSHTQAGWLELPLETLGLGQDAPYQMHDLLTDTRYLWRGRRNYVQIGLERVPAHIFRITTKP